MPYKYYKDNREFIKALDEAGDLVTVEQEVDWDMEMGAIVRRVCEIKGPSPYFKNIKDYEGFEAFGAPLATYRKLAISLGLPPDTPIPEICAAYLERTESGKSYPPVIVDRADAPCKEVVITGDDVNLFDLPAPMVHGGDGGRYLSTWHMIVGKDPDTQDINWGMYRQMVFDEKTMVGPVLPFSDMGKMFHYKHVPRNEPMPFATVIGMDPLAGIAACAPASIPEDEFCGMLMGEGVEMVKCETSDLYVPAHAEIIIEGDILPGIELEEAPFGEYTGYRTSPREPRTVYRVRCITYRKKPIMPLSNMGVPTDEGQLLRSFSLGLEMEKLLKSQGIPITGVYMWPESTHHLVVIGTAHVYTGIAQQIANLIFGSKLGPWFHMAVVVDEETDIYNKDEVIHAISTRCHPIDGIHLYENHLGTPLNPFASPEERKKSKGSKVLFDCLFPRHWKESDKPIMVSFNKVYPEDVKEKVLSNWTNYGFKD
ncbi:MAG: phenylphosphate carboxylase subunit alpha [Deltaproteobacteria bacterium]|nr:MAG: phenylphosphate carboxylase subunit alpha [Deltaproteobacteria bacterium]